jgi:hypothetical protein
MPDQTLPPCGIGGTSVSGGPCSGTYMVSQAGQDAFSLVDKVPVVSTLIAAGVIVAGVLFVLFIVRKVAGFFGGASAPVGGEPGTMEYDDNFWAARGKEANSSIPDAEFADDSAELDEEDDSPLELGYDGEEKEGADWTDDEFEAAEWREEYRREHEGDA